MKDFIYDYLRENAKPSGDKGYILLEIDKDETAELIRRGHFISGAFGIGWFALKIEVSKIMSDNTLKALLLMRGVLNENVDGSGI